MKICPFCAEEIKEAAIICKHCKKHLDGSDSSAEPLNDKFSSFIDFVKQDYPPWQVVSKNYKENYIILNKENKNSFSCLIFIILALFFVIPALIYLVFTMSQQAVYSVTIRFDQDGNPTLAEPSNFEWFIRNYDHKMKLRS
jgi:hypothetical protein